MMLRPNQRLLTLLAVFAASVAVLLYAFAAPGTHAANLHAVEAEVVVADSHAHSQGDHSHDDSEIAEDTDGPEHHHADHSHEKAELVRTDAKAMRLSAYLNYCIVLADLSEGPPYGIDRPPRPVTLS